MSLRARWPRRLMLVGAVALFVGAHAGNAPAQEFHSHGLVFQNLDKDFVLSGFEDLVARIDCPRGFTASTGVARLRSEFNTDARAAIFAKTLGKDYYEVKATSVSGVSSLVLGLICMKRETEPAPDEQGSEHSHKLAKPKIVSQTVALDPAGGATYSTIDCPKRLAAVGAASTVPEPYRTFIQEQSIISRFYAFVRGLAGKTTGSANAEMSLSCQQLTTKRANGHKHELDVQMVSKMFRTAGKAAAHDTSSGNNLQRKTLRCPKGYHALTPGYSTGRDSTFRLAAAEPKGRKMKFYYSLPEAETFFLSTVCMADTVS